MEEYLNNNLNGKVEQRKYLLTAKEELEKLTVEEWGFIAKHLSASLKYFNGDFDLWF